MVGVRSAAYGTSSIVTSTPHYYACHLCSSGHWFAFLISGIVLLDVGIALLVMGSRRRGALR
jgi:hypothetical protein